MTACGLRWHGFAVPKRGNTAEEYEDAFAGDAETARFAIADGASESSFASTWAKLLVEGYVQRSMASASGGSWVEASRQQWSCEVNTLELAWYAEAKRGLGASAAFLGLSLELPASNKTAGIWVASALGDCCCFQIHEDELVQSFPIIDAHDFNNHPELLSTQTQRKPCAEREHRGAWRAGDRFFLMTDALAQWFVSRNLEQGKPWQAIGRALLHPYHENAFARWVNELRHEGSLRNDDVTLVIIDP